MLSRTLLRMLTVQVLREIKALKGEVEDSLIVPIDEGKSVKWPDILSVVYTETMDRDWSNQRQPTIELAIELLAGIDDAFITESGEEVVIPKVMNAKAELYCDLVEDEIDASLRNISNEWADLWRQFVSIRGPVKSYCAVDAKGRKRALRRIVLPAQVYPSPIRGKALVGIWSDAIAKIESDGLAHYKAVAALIRKVLEGDGSLVDWAEGIELIGVDRQTAYILGLDSREDFDRTKALVPMKFTSVTGDLAASLEDAGVD